MQASTPVDTGLRLALRAPRPAAEPIWLRQEPGMFDDSGTDDARTAATDWADESELQALQAALAAVQPGVSNVPGIAAVKGEAGTAEAQAQSAAAQRRGTAAGQPSPTFEALYGSAEAAARPDGVHAHPGMAAPRHGLPPDSSPDSLERARCAAAHGPVYQPGSASDYLPPLPPEEDYDPNDDADAEPPPLPPDEPSEDDAAEAPPPPLPPPEDDDTADGDARHTAATAAAAAGEAIPPMPASQQHGAHLDAYGGGGGVLHAAVPGAEQGYAAGGSEHHWPHAAGQLHNAGQPHDAGHNVWHGDHHNVQGGGDAVHAAVGDVTGYGHAQQSGGGSGGDAFHAGGGSGVAGSHGPGGHDATWGYAHAAGGHLQGSGDAQWQHQRLHAENGFAQGAAAHAPHHAPLQPPPGPAPAMHGFQQHAAAGMHGSMHGAQTGEWAGHPSHLQMHAPQAPTRGGVRGSAHTSPMPHAFDPRHAGGGQPFHSQGDLQGGMAGNIAPQPQFPLQPQQPMHHQQQRQQQQQPMMQHQLPQAPHMQPQMPHQVMQRLPHLQHQEQLPRPQHTQLETQQHQPFPMHQPHVQQQQQVYMMQHQPSLMQQMPQQPPHMQQQQPQPQYQQHAQMQRDVLQQPHMHAQNLPDSNMQGSVNVVRSHSDAFVADREHSAGMPNAALASESLPGPPAPHQAALHSQQQATSHADPAQDRHSPVLSPGLGKRPRDPDICDQLAQGVQMPNPQMQSTQPQQQQHQQQQEAPLQGLAQPQALQQRVPRPQGPPPIAQGHELRHSTSPNQPQQTSHPGSALTPGSGSAQGALTPQYGASPFPAQHNATSPQYDPPHPSPRMASASPAHPAGAPAPAQALYAPHRQATPHQPLPPPPLAAAGAAQPPLQPPGGSLPPPAPLPHLGAGLPAGLVFDQQAPMPFEPSGARGLQQSHTSLTPHGQPPARPSAPS